MGDIDAQPTWNFGPHEWKLDDFDRARGRNAIAQIRQTLANARPPTPRAEKLERPEWLDDDIALPAAH